MELTISGIPNNRYLTGFDFQNNTDIRIPLSETGFKFSAPFLRLEHPFPDSAIFLRNGWNSYSASAWWYLNRKPWRVWNNPERTITAEDAASDTPEVHRSYLVTALSYQNECILIGTLDSESIVFDLNTNTIFGRSIDLVNKYPLENSCDFPDKFSFQENVEITDFYSATFFIAIGAEETCWKSYITALRSEINIRNKTKHNDLDQKQLTKPTKRSATQIQHSASQPNRKISPPTWCSWYSYFEEITEEIILHEINGAVELGYRALQIDDGWQIQVGDWQANHKFPSGMEIVATKISEAGLIPGIWLAPFIATADSNVFKTHPEFFIHDDSSCPLVVGHNWGQPFYGLDCTHPGAQEWLKELITEVTNWGYQYLKLDFIYAAAFFGNRYKNIPREAAYRKGLEIIRSTAPNSYLLGSGAVIAPSLGILDGIRVSSDTAPYWDVQDRHFDPTGPGLRNALRSTVARAWLREIIDIDPDVALFRSRGSLLSPEANAISWDASRIGGIFSCSDPYSWLNETEREEVKKLTSTLPLAHSMVEQLDRYRFKIENRIVDFEPWINPSNRISDRLLVK